MAIESTTFGPGTLIFTLSGAGGATVDASCQVSKCIVTWTKNKADDVRMLCGDVKPGQTTRTAQLTGTIDQDLGNVDGIVWLSWTHKGEQADVVYVPNTAADAQVTGVVTLDPLDVGGEVGGEDMTSDFTWDYVGEPTLAAVTP